MKTDTWTLVGEIGFYVAVAVLLALFFVKKWKQIKNAEKEQFKNKE